MGTHLIKDGHMFLYDMKDTANFCKAFTSLMETKYKNKGYDLLLWSCMLFLDYDQIRMHIIEEKRLLKHVMGSAYPQGAEIERIF